MDALVCIVIVNYRTADLVIDCLTSLCPEIETLPKLQVIVVDNASGDGSAEKLREFVVENKWHSWVSICPQERNGGFAYGNNAGITQALLSPNQVDYVMLLNPDTKIHSGAIRLLVEFMESHPLAGIAGSVLENAAGGTEPSAHNSPTPLGELISGARLSVLTKYLNRYTVTPSPRDTDHTCDWVSGASMLIRRAVIDAIGRMDEGFFLYFEEVDFCLRARKSGWEVWFASSSRVVHYEGSSTGIGNFLQRRPSYWFDSRRRFFIKHFGTTGLIMADVLWGIGRTSFLARHLLKLGNGGNQFVPRLFTFDMLWGDLRSLLTGRTRVS